MPPADRFGFFDSKLPYTVTYGELPHWEQEGATYFITFRTADSMPPSVSKLLVRQRDDWLRRHDINSNDGNWREDLKKCSHNVQREFHRYYATELETALDAGHGACVLGDRRMANIVADSLLYFDGFHVAASHRDSAGELRSNSATDRIR